MPDREYNSRKFQSQTVRQLVAGAIILILFIGLSFVSLRLGEGALFAAIGTFALIGLVIVLCWLVLKAIEWLAGSDE
jgi:hypothetical protein